MNSRTDAVAGAITDTAARGVEIVSMTKRFGSVVALEDVSMTVPAGDFHALLGENGAGKSTLVKCLTGFYRPDAGQVAVDGREAVISHPRDAHRLGLGMVYQHFTLAPSMTGAENLIIAADRVPAIIHPRRERERLGAFLDTMPFAVDLDRPVGRLAAGERQKLEIFKQFWLGRGFLILDEPTSVLTPQEADDVLGHVGDLCDAGRVTVLMITHKLREVEAFARAATVLRAGRHVGGGPVQGLSREAMARMMVGAEGPAPGERAPAGAAAGGRAAATARARPDPHAGHEPGGSSEAAAPVRLRVEGVRALDRRGAPSIRIDALEIRAGELVGVAGVAGNGQTELLELLSGQRPLLAGSVSVDDAPFAGTRRQQRERGVRFLPEEPLANACAPALSLAENLSMREFDVDTTGRPRLWLDRVAMRHRAQRLIEAFGVRAGTPAQPIASLSGGNVQRAVLARELDGDVRLLIVANPCFGLDVGATGEIRARLHAARDAGCAVLMLSEDLDEVLELADRVLVMSDGRIVFETPARDANRMRIGAYMAGTAGRANLGRAA